MAFGNRLINTTVNGGPQIWVAAGLPTSGKNLKYSTDGINFTDVVSTGLRSDTIQASVGYNGTYFFASIAGSPSHIRGSYSTDGINFISCTGSFPASRLYHIYWSGSKWFGVGDDKLWASDDLNGNSWYDVGLPGVARYCVVGGNTIWSYDPVPPSTYLTYRSTQNGANFANLTAGMPNFGNQSSVMTYHSASHIVLPGGYGNTPYYSINNGSTWTACSGTPGGVWWRGVYDGVNTYLPYENTRRIYKSSDGINFSITPASGFPVDFGEGNIFDGTSSWISDRTTKFYKSSDQWASYSIIETNLSGPQIISNNMPGLFPPIQ